MSIHASSLYYLKLLAWKALAKRFKKIRMGKQGAAQIYQSLSVTVVIWKHSFSMKVIEAEVFLIESLI